MAFYSIFGDAALDAFAAPTSARDVGQEMLHATLLLSCAFFGWCASSALISTLGWLRNDQNEGKGKEGSGAFREEVAAYVQANTIEDASKHFGLSHAEIRNCIDTVEQSQCQVDQWKVGQIWKSLQEAVLQTATSLFPSIRLNGNLKQTIEADCEQECEDVCTLDFSIAPSFHPGLMLLEQYGVFGASSGMWSGSVEASPIPRDMLPDIDYSIVEEDGKSVKSAVKLQLHAKTLLEEVDDASSEEDSFESSTHAEAGRMWVPLEYNW